MEKENKMGTAPVNKLFISMSIPMILSMLVQALYNIVDSIFVAQLSENALTAVSLAFPAQNLMIAFAVGTCVGINALVSRCLGEKDINGANNIANTGVFLCVFTSIAFLIAGLFGSQAFFKAQTTNTEIISLATTYLKICTFFSFGMFIQIAFERLLQSTGKTFYAMLTQLLGAIINIILDPIMIFGLFGFPKMGIAGAATATVTGQIVAAITAVILNEKVNKELSIKLKSILCPKKSGIISIYQIGIPTIIMNCIGSVMTFGLNKILILFSETAVAVLGVYFKLQSFVFMPVFGLNNAMIPIIGYNYGARKKDRLIKTIKLSVFYAVGIMMVGFLIMQIFPKQLFMLFNASEHMISIGVPALRTVSTCFIFAGYCIVISSVFQALGKSMFSLFVSLGRQLIILLPAAYLLSLSGNVRNVWLAFPIAEVMSLTLCTLFYIHIYKKIITNI